MLIDCDSILNADYSSIFMIACGDCFTSIKVGYLELAVVSGDFRSKIGA